MIIFDLACDAEHRFEGWFSSTEAFDSQVENGLLDCPVCGSNTIRRIPSAVHLGTGAPSATDRPSQNTAVAAVAKEDIVSAYRQRVLALLESSEDVGSDFADEARKILLNEAPARMIHGETTDEDLEGLAEEGIEVIRLLVPKAKTGKLH